MKRITKKQRKRLDELTDQIASEHNKLEQAVNRYNAAVREAEIELEEAEENYNYAVSAAAEFIEELYDTGDSYRLHRSDRWQDSEAGDNYSEWLDQIENALGFCEEVELTRATEAEIDFETPLEAISEIQDAPEPAYD